MGFCTDHNLLGIFMRSAYYRAACKSARSRDPGNPYHRSSRYAMVTLGPWLLPHEYHRDGTQFVGSSILLGHSRHGATPFASETIHSAARPAASCILCRQATASILSVLKLPKKLAERRRERWDACLHRLWVPTVYKNKKAGKQPRVDCSLWQNKASKCSNTCSGGYFYDTV